MEANTYVTLKYADCLALLLSLQCFTHPNIQQSYKDSAGITNYTVPKSF